MSRNSNQPKIKTINRPQNDQALLKQLSPAAQIELFHHFIAEDLSVFLRKVFETVSPGDAFLTNWHIDAMVHAANQIINGKVKRLVTNIPPRHLKSIIFSVALPAFVLGHDPTKRIICVSYSGELATKLANDFRAVMNSQWYRKAFPKTRISREKDTERETMTTSRGFRYATSLGGTLTGRGADIIILDDPQKPDEALSEPLRNSAGSWFDSTLSSRLDSKTDGAIVLVMQRLHEDDLSGRLLAKGGWFHLRIPAIADVEEQIQIGPRQTHRRKPGKVIDERRDSHAALENLRRSMGAFLFSAQYQQEPIPLEGNLIKAVWF